MKALLHAPEQMGIVCGLFGQGEIRHDWSLLRERQSLLKGGEGESERDTERESMGAPCTALLRSRLHNPVILLQSHL